MRIGLVIAVTLLLAGCGSSPEPFNATPLSISYKYRGDEITDAAELANKHCAPQGKTARLANVGHDSAWNVATFTCN